MKRRPKHQNSVSPIEKTISRLAKLCRQAGLVLRRSDVEHVKEKKRWEFYIRLEGRQWKGQTPNITTEKQSLLRQCLERLGLVEYADYTFLDYHPRHTELKRPLRAWVYRLSVLSKSFQRLMSPV
jgi:hypothetical protein